MMRVVHARVALLVFCAGFLTACVLLKFVPAMLAAAFWLSIISVLGMTISAAACIFNQLGSVVSDRATKNG